MAVAGPRRTAKRPRTTELVDLSIGNTSTTGDSRSLARNHWAPESASAQTHVIISEEFHARAF
jgi:hypothetical protein